MTKRLHMRIALLSAEYPPAFGGIGDYTRLLAHSLAVRGHAVFVITIAEQQMQIIDCGSNTRTAVCNLRTSRWNWQSWRAVIAAIDVVRPHVLHIQYQTGAYGMHPAINFLPWRLHGVLGHPRVVVTAHDLLEPYLFPKAGIVRRYVTKRLLQDADATITTNSVDQNSIERLTGRTAALIPIGSNIRVMPPEGYNREVWRKGHGVGKNDVLVGYFGLLGRSKGVDVLLNALALLPAHFRLVIIGGEATSPQDVAYAAAVREHIATKELTARVLITGQVQERDVSAHLLAADMVALPYADGASFRRGSLLAALDHGMPVITTQVGTKMEHGQPALRDAEHALLVPPGHAQALAMAIQRLAADNALRERIGAAGRGLAAHFSWQRIAEQHEQLYQDVTPRR